MASNRPRLVVSKRHILIVMDANHEQRVAPIIASVHRHYKNKTPFKIYRGATNATRHITFDKNKMVDVSHLNHVLHIDPKRKVAIVEPNVPMDALVRATLRYGLVPPVVMEFPGITVGGGIQGGAGESSSYKWGTFNRTVNWYELILANGERMRCSRTEHADLFWGSAGAYGSLGVITRAEVQLIKAKRFVELTYQPVTSFADAVATLKQAVRRAPDFVDGIMFSPTQGVIMTGITKNTTAAPQHTFTKPTDEWFYLHAQQLANTGKKHTIAIPLYDYLFRYDRGAFWMGRFGFERLKTPFNRLTRTLLNPLMHTRKMYQALQASGVAQECIIQDLALPAKNAAHFMQYIHDTFGIYPLWLCPLLPDADSPFLSSNIRTDLVINVGVWGRYKGTYTEWLAANAALETTLTKLGGKKWLYAQTFYTEQKFWNIYGGKRRYEQLRKKYAAVSLPSIYDKVRLQAPQKISAKRGVLTAVLGVNSLRKR